MRVEEGYWDFSRVSPKAMLPLHKEETGLGWVTGNDE